MFSFFRRKPPNTSPTPPRTTSIGEGDLVVCINDDWLMLKCPVPPGQHPVLDQVYRVNAVKMQNRNPAYHPGPWLYLCLRPDVGYAPEHFRKVQIDHTPAEEAFTRSIRDLVKEDVS